MATLYEHIKGYYWSEVPKTSPNTYILNSDRDIRIDIGSDQGAIIGRLPAGTLVTIDEEQINYQWGWKRIMFIPGLATYLPQDLLDAQKELLPTSPEKRAAWVDWSGLGVYPPPDPEPEPPDPEPEPPDPEPEPPDPEPPTPPEFPKILAYFTVFDEKYRIIIEQLR
jgi:hypothetical protein